MQDKTHSEIVEAMENYLQEMPPTLPRSPEGLAIAAMDLWLRPDTDRHIEHGCREHYKQIARAVLAGRYGRHTREFNAHQLPLDAEVFGDQLQEAYPRRTKRGDVPIYVPLEVASDDDLLWNIAQLRRTGQGFLRHADALQAYVDRRGQDDGGQAA